MTAGIRIVKLSGAGNDFVALGPEQIARLGDDLVPWIRRVCRRGLSVGADGVLLVEPAGAGRVRVRFHNPDGSIAFCGNGTRCAARFARDAGFAGERMVLSTAVGEVPAEFTGLGVRLTLPPPEDRGPLAVELETGERVQGRHVVAGVPHFVIEVEDVDRAPLARWGPPLRRHEAFGAAGTNVDVTQGTAGGTLSVRTWERGVEGETLSCGTGAVAAAYVWWLTRGSQPSRVVPAAGVPLGVTFTGAPEAPGEVRLEGDARVVFATTLAPEATGFDE